MSSMDYEEACEVLGIDPNAEITESDLKKAYKRAAIRHHPDKRICFSFETKQLRFFLQHTRYSRKYNLY